MNTNVVIEDKLSYKFQEQIDNSVSVSNQSTATMKKVHLNFIITCGSMLQTGYESVSNKLLVKDSAHAIALSL